MAKTQLQKHKLKESEATLHSPLPSFVLALRTGAAGVDSALSWDAGAAGGLSAAVSTVTVALAAAKAVVAAAEPRRGLLVLNSLHFAPRTIIILETAILGFLAAIRGLWDCSEDIMVTTGWTYI